MNTKEYLKQKLETEELPTFSVIKGGKYKEPKREVFGIGKELKDFLESRGEDG